MDWKYKSVIFGLLLILAASGDEEIPVEEDTNELELGTCQLEWTPLDDLGLEGEITSVGYPAPYPISNHICELNFSPGYGIEVEVIEVDIDSSNGDGFLFFRGGKEIDTQEKGPVITWSIPKERELKFKIYHSSSLFVQFSSTKVTTTRKGFKLRYKRTGEITTTEEPTTSTTPLPTVGPDVPVPTIEVNIFGMSPREFKHNLDEFTEVMSNITNDFIQTKPLNYVEECQPTNVQVELINYCPINWPNHEKCAEIRFSIPLFIKKEETSRKRFSKSLARTTASNVTAFELSKKHLEELWRDYSADSRLLAFGIEPYVLPDNGMLLLLWVGISLAVVLIFMLVLIVIWKTNIFAPYSRMHDPQNRNLARDSDLSSQQDYSRSSNTDSLFDPNDNRTADPSGEPGSYDPELLTVVPSQGHYTEISLPEPRSAYPVDDGIYGIDNHGMLSEDTHSDNEELTFRRYSTSNLADRRSDPIPLRGIDSREYRT